LKLIAKAGETSKTVKVFIADSSVTTGAGLTGLVFNTASLTAYYIREGANAAVAITLAAGVLGTFTNQGAAGTGGGFIVADGTNLPGVYELSIPDAALAAGAKSVLIMLKGAANMTPTLLEIQLVAFDPYDAAGLGLTGVAVGSLANNSITAASIATDAIGAAELATDAATEIQSGLSTTSGTRQRFP
jgi:hypothetical protein